MNKKIVIFYVVYGPILGAFIVATWCSAFIVLPDLVHDPENTYGHNRGSEYLGLMGLILVLAYPIGIVPALASGIIHSTLMNRFKSSRLQCACMVASVGAFAMVVELVWLPASSFMLVLVALCTAFLLALRLSCKAVLHQ